MAQGADGAVVGGEGVLNDLVGEEKMSSSPVMCAFFTEIERMDGNTEDNFAGTIVKCGIGVGCRVI